MTNSGFTAAHWQPGRRSYEQPKPHGMMNSAEVLLLTGLSYRQLDYALREGYVRIKYEASGSGSQRLFSKREVSILFAYASIQEAGTPKERLRDAMDLLHNDEEWGDYLYITPDAVVMGTWGETTHDRAKPRWSTLVPLRTQDG